MENLSDLICNITPLYNKYKQNKTLLSGTESLEIMWAIGDLLKIYITTHKIKPHHLYRSVYGKSEGSTNIIQKSYIPREFQGRCYRIRNIFKNKNDIRKQLPTLSSFTCFREAMPFFDNKKYLLVGKERTNLLTLLNSRKSPKEILKSLPKELIGIKNPRTQKLHELEREKKQFIELYNHVYKIVKLNDYDLIKKEIKEIDIEFIEFLAKNTTALAKDGLKFFELFYTYSIPSPWKEWAILIEGFMKQKNQKKVRRFRRLIPPERILRLADMFYALLSEDNYNSFS